MRITMQKNKSIIHRCCKQRMSKITITKYKPCGNHVEYKEHYIKCECCHKFMQKLGCGLGWMHTSRVLFEYQYNVVP
jgi:hypothetical protein